MVRACCLYALLVVAGWAGPPPAHDAPGAPQARAPPAAGSAAPRPAGTPVAGNAALGEFESLSQTDVDLYLKVMRTAAGRLKNLPPADRKALDAQKSFSAQASSGQTPSAEEFAAMERATELLALDGSVAREMGVEKRYQSIKGRVPQYGMPEMTGEGDEPLTAEERARVAERVKRFKERKKNDEALFAPYKDEIQALQKQVDLVTHPESILR